MVPVKEVPVQPYTVKFVIWICLIQFLKNA